MVLATQTLTPREWILELDLNKVAMVIGKRVKYLLGPSFALRYTFNVSTRPTYSPQGVKEKLAVPLVT